MFLCKFSFGVTPFSTKHDEDRASARGLLRIGVKVSLILHQLSRSQGTIIIHSPDCTFNLSSFAADNDPQLCPSSFVDGYCKSFLFSSSSYLGGKKLLLQLLNPIDTLSFSYIVNQYFDGLLSFNQFNTLKIFIVGYADLLKSCI